MGTDTGAVLAQLRKQAGHSQESLAETLDVNRAYVSRVETGDRKPSWRFLMRFAEILHIPSEDLLRSAGLIATPAVSELELAAYVAAYPDLAAVFEYARENPRLLADLARYAGMLIQEMGHDANNPAEDDRKESVPPD